MSVPRTEERSHRARLLVGVGFAVSIVASLALFVTYALGGQNQVEGLLLFLAFGGIGFAIVVLAHRMLGSTGDASEPREPLPSQDAARDAVARDADVPELAGGDRRFFLRLLAGALGALGLAALLPALSLGPISGGALFSTQWKRGSRLVTEAGEPISVDDLRPGGIVTVFPEGHADSADSQTVLIRAEPELIVPIAGREDWTPDGYLAYSKVCTHAGCPVGLYDQSNNTLLCPCHQSTFDVLDGAKRIFGPAPRPLPQLPLAVDDEGFLYAQDDYDEPIGPGFWNRLL